MLAVDARLSAVVFFIISSLLFTAVGSDYVGSRSSLFPMPLQSLQSHKCPGLLAIYLSTVFGTPEQLPDWYQAPHLKHSKDPALQPSQHLPQWYLVD